MKSSRTGLRAMAKWLLAPLRDYPLAVVTTLAIIFALMFAIYLKSEKSFRLIGLALQLFGIATVALNIRSTRKQFGLPGIFGQVAEWLRQFPPSSSTPIFADLSIAMESARLKARGEVWLDVNRDASLEARLDVVENNLLRARQSLAEFRQETEENLAQQANALAQEKQARVDDDKHTRETLHVLATGGLSISAAGIVCLVVGVIMSTASMELADWFEVRAPLHVHIPVRPDFP
jgi:hypothetical protein